MDDLYSYEYIDKFSSECYNWYKGQLLKERLLYAEIVVLLLEAIRPLGGKHEGKAYGEMSLSILASRLFNDCEGSQLLLLRGLPAQAQTVIRDIIECTMLFRLFLRNSEFATRWSLEAKEYQLGEVNTRLLELGIEAKEYALYGPLSHEAHSNLLASLSSVQEKVGKEGTLRTYHFGSLRTPETIFFVQQGFISIFFLLHMCLIEPLAEYYSQHSTDADFNKWAEKVNDIFPKIEELVNEVNNKKEPRIDQKIFRLVEKKMRMKDFKRILTGSEDSN